MHFSNTDKIFSDTDKIFTHWIACKVTYEGCPKMPYNCIISLKLKTRISLIHMYPVGNLFLDILLKLHKIS